MIRASFCSRNCLAVILMLGICFVGAAEEKQSNDDEQPSIATPRNPDVSADLGDWDIRFDGFAGTPGDRSSFHVTLSYDGTMLVEKWRRKNPRRKIFEGRLSEEETQRFLKGTSKVINESRGRRRRGDREDGWNLTVRISGKAKDSGKKLSRTVSFEDHGPPSDKVVPGFSEMVKVIREKMNKWESFPE